MCVDLGFGIEKASADNHFRLLGVSCPEVRGAERVAGLAAKAFVVDWMVATEQWPLIIQTERIRNAEVRTFERWVASVWRVSDGASLSDALIASGHGVPSKG